MGSVRRFVLVAAIATASMVCAAGQAVPRLRHAEPSTHSMPAEPHGAVVKPRDCHVSGVTLRHRSLTYYDANSYVACSNGAAGCYVIERVHDTATQVACPRADFQRRIDAETAVRARVAASATGGPFVPASDDVHRRRLSLVVVSTTRIWDGGVVCYQLSEELPFDAQHEEYIYVAMGKYENHTNVRFVPTATCAREALPYCDACANYVDFKHPTRGRDCNASIGITDDGAQVMNLAERCFEVDDELKTVYGSAMHEIGHSVGMYHEHQHPSRSVAVFWDTVEQGLWSELAVRDLSVGGPYDQDSVMHYPMSYGFCQPNYCSRSTTKTNCVDEDTKFCNLNQDDNDDDDCVDITKELCNKTATEAIGQRKDLSAGDVAAINELYPTAAWPASDSKIGG
ncbi:unnamed protein product [Hyaloperonospora brassicae]|uniref:Metalloendopeptidase n=1 Tax=Hyaloperonospora brassicae TaxID=162125 RepID=A0AAV0US33_HYABA|nr:unnamed protein product [Hyaloperonospora brassicae]